MDFSGKFKIDPYFEKSTTNEMKLPVRFNVLQAYKSGADGVHIGKTQAITEGSPDVVIEKYTRGEKEIDKILNELGITNKKGVTTKISDTGTEYDGTYLKFTDDVKKAIEEQGINAFKLGGPVKDNDLPNVGTIEPFSPINPSFAGGEYIDPRFGDPVEKKLKQGFGVFKNIKEFILPQPKLTEPLSMVDYVVGSTPLGKGAIATDKVRKLIHQVRNSKQKNVRRSAIKELIDSEDLKLFKETNVTPIKERLGASYSLAAAKFDNVLLRVPENDSIPITKINNIKTGKPYTAKEIDDVAYDSAGRTLNYLFKTLEGGGNPARKIIREYPEVTALYRKSGREIPPVQPRPEYLKDYIDGKAGSSLKDGGPVDIDKMLAEL